MTRQEIIQHLEKVEEELRAIIAPHENIQDADPQYDDPELWWSIPTLECVQNALRACNE